MKTYRVSIGLEVEVEAFDEADALEAVQDCFGPGENGSCLVTEYSVLDHEPV